MIKINLHKDLFLHLDGTREKWHFFTNKLYISDVCHIFLNRRDVKAYENQCFVWSLVWYQYVKFQTLGHGLYMACRYQLIRIKYAVIMSTLRCIMSFTWLSYSMLFSVLVCSLERAWRSRSVIDCQATARVRFPVGTV